MESESNIKEGLPVLNRPEVIEFIEDRQIKPEDFYLIEQMALFSKNTIIEKLHNFFNLNRERSGAELQKMIVDTKEAKDRDLYVLVNEFYLKYDWAVSWNLVRVLEQL